MRSMLSTAAFAALALATIGCGDDPEPPATCASSGQARAAVFSALAFTREEPEGVAPGFDLDGRISDANDSVTCGKQDFVDPDGRPGIDNQLAALVPDVEAVVGNAVDGLVQGAVNDGQLVILMEMSGVDDWVNDECVDLRVQIGNKTSQTLGTDGVVEAWQTYDPDPASEISVAPGGRITDGVFEAGPFLVAIPIAIFDVAFTIHARDARFRFSIDEEGKMVGHFGGGLEPDEILAGVSQGAGTEDIIPAIKLAMEASKDLGGTAETDCTQISSALAFSAVPAFIRR